MIDEVDVTADRILEAGPGLRRARLSAVLDASRKHVTGSAGHERALSFNALLCTRLREIAKARGIADPWMHGSR